MFVSDVCAMDLFKYQRIMYKHVRHHGTSIQKHISLHRRECTYYGRFFLTIYIYIYTCLGEETGGHSLIRNEKLEYYLRYIGDPCYEINMAKKMFYQTNPSKPNNT